MKRDKGELSRRGKVRAAQVRESLESKAARNKATFYLDIYNDVVDDRASRDDDDDDVDTDSNLDSQTHRAIGSTTTANATIPALRSSHLGFRKIDFCKTKCDIRNGQQ